MALVYIGSVREFAGKNLVSVGLGRRMLNDGYKLGFVKPLGAKPYKVEGVYTDADAWNVNQTLELGQSPEDCCPVLITQDLIADTLRGRTGDLMQQVKDHCEKVSQGKDVVILCGAGTLRSGAMFDLSGYETVLALGAKAVIVERYENDFFLDDLISAVNRLGDNLAGVIINSVDTELRGVLEEQVRPFLAQRGVKTFGLLPKDDLLSSVSVREVANILGAKCLTGLNYHQRLIKRFFIGAMQVSHAGQYFGGGRGFACIVGGDRPDMQLAAIQGGAACLILTGNFYPGDMILAEAEEREVTVMVVRDDTFTVARKLDTGLGRASLKEPEKITRAVELMDQNVEFAALYKALGLKKG